MKDRFGRLLLLFGGPDEGHLQLFMKVWLTDLKRGLFFQAEIGDKGMGRVGRRSER
jgi:hypothetical protein